MPRVLTLFVMAGILSAQITRHEIVPGGIGPRSTPTIHQGKVYVLGATGMGSAVKFIPRPVVYLTFRSFS